jgi:hypothetical protein
MIAPLNRLATWNGTARITSRLLQRLNASLRSALGTLRTTLSTLPGAPSTLRGALSTLLSALSEGGDVCPRCGGSELRRSYIRWYEGWRQLFPNRPHRCQACYHRMWRRPSPELAQALVPARAAFAVCDSRSLTIDLTDLDAPWGSPNVRTKTDSPQETVAVVRIEVAGLLPVLAATRSVHTGNGTNNARSPIGW